MASLVSAEGVSSLPTPPAFSDEEEYAAVQSMVHAWEPVVRHILHRHSQNVASWEGVEHPRAAAHPGTHVVFIVADTGQQLLTDDGQEVLACGRELIIL